MSKKSYKFTKIREFKEKEIFPHKHCPVCNKMIPPDAEYCSEVCENYVKNKEKEEKKRNIMMLVIFVAIMAAFIVIMLIIGAMAGGS